MRTSTFEQFVELATHGNFVPVYKEIMADLLTPVSAFLKIAEHSDYAFLLESVEGGEQVARYSFLGKDPFLLVRANDDMIIVERGGVTEEKRGDLIGFMRQTMAEYRAPYVPDLPRFTGGAVGFISYDAVRWFEPIELGGHRDMPTDEAGFMLFDTVLAFDHVRHRILIISNAHLAAGEELDALYQFALAKIDFLERELERALSRASVKSPATSAPPAFVSNVGREAFEASVRETKEHIAAGDIYQAVMSQRFNADVTADAFTVYRALRHVNPSPYMYFIRLGGVSLVGSSPEMLVRVESRHVETHPIAGTRPRGSDPAADDRLAEELKSDEKERAEHMMLVDLGRNDLGRVCSFGSVRVPQLLEVERYSHVIHLVSTVEGELADDQDRFDALVACFPAGTVSGAPKIRAMQIIGRIEPVRRGIYAGAIGYLDFAGNLDFCIAIRTIVMCGRRAYVQAGAGIVADSDPAAEFEETHDKARTMMRALEMAEAGLE